MTGVSATSSAPSPITPNWSGFTLVPGIILTAIIALLSMRFSEWFGEAVLGFDKSPISGVMIAIIFGIAIANTTTMPLFLKPGISFSMKNILKLGR